MYSPKIDEELIPKLYKLGQKLKKPMTHVVNRILGEALAMYKSGFNVQKLVAKTDGALALRSKIHKSEKWSCCPLCYNDFQNANGQTLSVSLRSGKSLKVLICSRCHEKEKKTG